jgi:hypothetical protein
MAINSSWCPVLQSYVTRVTDLEGAVAAVFCAEYEKGTRTCRMKREALGRKHVEECIPRERERHLSHRGSC